MVFGGVWFGLQQIILEQIVFGETLLSLGFFLPEPQGLSLTPETVVGLRKIRLFLTLHH